MSGAGLRRVWGPAEHRRYEELMARSRPGRVINLRWVPLRWIAAPWMRRHARRMDDAGVPVRYLLGGLSDHQPFRFIDDAISAMVACPRQAGCDGSWARRVVTEYRHLVRYRAWLEEQSRERLAAQGLTRPG